jgi:membrane-associated phospholipid phosphatase
MIQNCTPPIITPTYLENYLPQKATRVKTFIQQNKIFLILYLLFLIAGGFVIALFEKGDEIVYFSSLHSGFFNSLFPWITRLGELPAAIFILLLVFASSYGRGILLSINLAVIFPVVYVLKKIVFASQVRPSVFFEGKMHLDYVPGVEVLQYNSFPSGHSAAAFGIFFMLSIFAKDKKLALIYFAMALLVAVSRIYLLEHFLRDVYFGSMIGICSAALVWLVVAQSKFYNNLWWKDKSLFNTAPASR